MPGGRSLTMQSRTASPALLNTPRRRRPGFYVVVTLILVGTYFFASQTHTALDEIRAEQGTGAAAETVGQSEKAGRHAIDEFVKGFPKLRGSGNLGAPDLTRRGDDEEKTHFDWARTRKMFVFGDSYSTLDVDYKKNGVDGGHHQQLHGTATDMKWSDYLYAVFHDYHVMQYYNFARPGAVIDPVIVPPGLASYGTLQTQVGEFEDMFTPMPGPPRANWHGNDTLFIVFFGINDLGRLNREDLGRQDIHSTTKALAKSLVDSTKRLQGLGGQHFLIINIPPLEHSPKYSLPGEVGIASRELIGESVRVYNRYLQDEVDAWKAEEGDKTAMLFDLEKYWRLIVDYPEVFGLTECGRYQMWIDEKRPNLGRMGYCFHDNQHISWSAAELLARNVNGFLHRHSASFHHSNATETALRA